MDSRPHNTATAHRSSRGARALLFLILPLTSAAADLREDFSATEQVFQSWVPCGRLADGTWAQRLGKARPERWTLEVGALRGQNFPEEKHPAGISRKDNLPQAKLAETGARISRRIKVTETSRGTLRLFGLTASPHQKEATDNHVLALDVSCCRKEAWEERTCNSIPFIGSFTVYRMKTYPSPTTPRSDHTAALLRSRIIDGEFDPGVLLAESAVARELGVSRVPVREALFALERDGLVSFSETGRAYVTELSPHDFEQLYVLRLALEPVAARLAAPALREDSSALEKNIVATSKASSLIKVTHLDLDFHEIVLEASGNARLLKLWRSLRGELELWLARLHRSKQIQTRGTREETVSTHRDLLECFRLQSPAVCERKMRGHVLGWREWLPVLTENE